MRIDTWLTLLTEDEPFVIQRHLIDGMDIFQGLPWNIVNAWATNFQRPNEQSRHTSVYVIQRHLIDGIDKPRIVEEYRLR